jgi:kinesin family protein C2/C3
LCAVRLEQKADELENNYRIAAATESDLQYRLEKAEEESVMLQSDLEEKMSQHAEDEQRLRTDMADMESEMVALKAKLETSAQGSGSDPAEQAAAPAPEPPASDAALQAVQQQLADSKKAVGQYERDMEELTERLLEEEEKNEKLASEVAELTEDLMSKQEKDTGTEMASAHATELEESRQQAAEWKSKHEQLTQELTETTDELAKKSDELSSTGEQLAAIQTSKDDEINSYLEKNTQLNAEASKLQIMIADQKAELQEHSANVEELTRNNEKLQKTKEDSMNSQQAAAAELSKAQKGESELIAKLEAEAEAAAADAQAKGEATKKATEQHKELLKEKGEVDAALVVLETKHQSLEQESEQMQAELAQLKEAAAVAASAEPEKPAETAAAPGEDADDTTAELKSQLAEQAQKEVALQQAMEEAQEDSTRKLRQLEGDKASLQQEISGLHARLEAASAERANGTPPRPVSSMVVASSADANGNLPSAEAVHRMLLLERERCASLLHKLQEAKGNINVICRIRPTWQKEKTAGASEIVDVLSREEAGFYDKRSRTWRSFKFDSILGPNESQQQVYQEFEPLSLAVVDGYNACVFAYGQTGSGKTFTMQGPSHDPGMNTLLLNKIFEVVSLRGGLRTDSSPSKSVSGQDGEENGESPPTDLEEQEPSTNKLLPSSPAKSESKAKRFEVQVAMLEIYNEEVRDLLQPTPTSSGPGPAPKRANLDIRFGRDGGVQVINMEQKKVQSPADVLKVFEQGNMNRAVATTNVHEHSSRSHMVLMIDVTGTPVGGPGSGTATRGRLSLVDLAGSERISKSEVVGEQLKEAQHINRSLSALGDVMEALDNKAKHIPYRNSKLTYLLQVRFSCVLHSFARHFVTNNLAIFFVHPGLPWW